MPSNRTERYVALDGLRGIAALAVVQFHSTGFSIVFLPASYLAVDLFFMISGFVLANAYEKRIDNGQSALDFMRVRYIRLYPLYLVALILGVSFILLQAISSDRPLSVESVLASSAFSILLLPTPAPLNATGSDLFPFVYPAWSLFFELGVNAFYALLIPFLRTPFLCCIVAVGAMLVGLTAVEFDTLNTGYNWDNIAGGGARVIFGFFVGVLLFRFPLRSSPSFLTPLIMLLVTAIFAAPAFWGPSRLYDLTCVFLIFPAVVAVAASCSARRSSARVYLFLGVISYALYAIHGPAIWWFKAIWPEGLMAVYPSLDPLKGWILILVLILAAHFLDRTFDSRVRRLLLGANLSRTGSPKTTATIRESAD
jgi:peptidoglycan/LPS O-acetylase OafA/YrhL